MGSFAKPKNRKYGQSGYPSPFEAKGDASKRSEARRGIRVGTRGQTDSTEKYGLTVAVSVGEARISTPA